MPYFKVGERGLKVMRRDKTLVQYPPHQVVFFRELPARFEGALTLIAEPSAARGETENKRRVPTERKPEPAARVDFGGDTD